MNFKLVEVSETGTNKPKLKNFLVRLTTSTSTSRSFCRMFAVLTRSVPHRALAHPLRSMATNRPPPPRPPKAQPSPHSEPPSPPPTITPSSVPSLDFSPPEPSTGERQRTGARSSKGSLSSAERQRRTMSRAALLMLAAALSINTIYMGREWDADELKAKKMVASYRFACPDVRN